MPEKGLMSDLLCAGNTGSNPILGAGGLECKSSVSPIGPLGTQLSDLNHNLCFVASSGTQICMCVIIYVCRAIHTGIECLLVCKYRFPLLYMIHVFLENNA